MENKMSLIERLENNHFIDDLRQHLIFNDDEYASLLAILNDINKEYKEQGHINKIIASY